MAYSQYVITAITDIPTLVNTFAAAQGWTVTGTADLPILKHPSYGAGIEFQLSAAITGYDHELKWTAVGAPVVTSTARVRSPKLNGTVAVPVVSLPTKVHLFSALVPEPYIVIVIEYGFNLYRHLYFGYLEKLGVFEGGEVIGGAGFGSAVNQGGATTSKTFRADSTAYLFNAYQSQWAAADAGGVHVDHINNAVPWRQFRGAGINGSAYLLLTTSVAIGGFKDDINDGYMVRGKSSYAGSNILVPVTLYGVKVGGDPPSFAPIGRPAGVRMVHMQDIDPGGAIVIGADTWRCFPAWCKSANESIDTLINKWGSGETSSWVGYAYPEG